MFQFQDVVNAVKDLAANDPAPHQSHCRLLEKYAKELGFQSYHHFIQSLRHLPPEQFPNVSLRLMRDICMKKIPSLDEPYFEFQAYSAGKVGFYSEWAGWDKFGNEVRVPRPLEGVDTANGLRRLAEYPVYVVESARELLAWRFSWRSTALVPQKLAKEFFAFAFERRCLVEKNPPMDLVKARAQRYANNISNLD